VSVAAGSWILTDATRRRFDPSDPLAPPRIERVSETLRDLGGDLAQLDASVGLLSIGELREYIAARTADGRDPSDARERLHRRLADPLAVALFAWLALPLGFAVEQTRSLAFSALVGIALIGVYYSLRTLASLLAASGVAGAALGPWLLLSAFGGLGAWRMSRVRA
jgi:lipopolysaccharide export LptBFGC system permease protein LptF